jgi:AraC-like DNA-binding protein
VITVELEKPDCIENLQLYAVSLKSKVTENSFSIPDAVGAGFAWAEMLPCGITVMVYEGLLKHDLSTLRSQTAQQYYILQLSEVTAPKNDPNKRRRLPSNAVTQSSVSLKDTTRVYEQLTPEGTKVCSIEFIFNAEHLKSLIPGEVVDDLVNNGFPSVILNDALEPIDRIYRVTLDDLFTEKIDHPLRLNFIQNRVLLLLEKFILKLYTKKAAASGKRNKDDEVSRLMQIEGLLVKDFSVAPPTIEELSRISAMSPTKLKNDFKSTYGLPIYEYYQKNRMLKAKSLLLEGQYSIKEVGMLVGYSNLSHFANTFKKEFGILPSELTSKDGMLVYNT